MADMNAALAALHTHFGFEDFREGQREVVESILEGHDTVVVMPTGGGKSLCYQLPALMREGATLVVSPLIALMKDQVDALHARGLPATFINSSIDFEEQKARINAMREGRFKLVYVAPERFRSQHFVETLRRANVELFAVDEAHCISQWGHDFRPDYLRLKSFVEQIGRPQTVALTATATPYVRADIIEQLSLRDPRAFVSGFDRPNLSIGVVHTQKEREKIARVRALAAACEGGSGIVYASTRKSVEQVTQRLKEARLSVVGYHAGMTDDERVRAQDEFMSGRTQMIVATNAFGMGIDKPDIRFVTHYQMPGSVEAYYQEIGRAGRDGQPSTCVLLFNYADKRTQDYFIEGSYPQPELIAKVYEALVATGQQRVELSTREIAARAGIRNEMAVQSALVTLEKAGHVERVAGEGRARAILMLDDEPQRTLRIRPQELARRAALEQRKLREVISFCYTERCYRAFILDYFGDRAHARECGRCGNCLSAAGEPSDASALAENACESASDSSHASRPPVAPASQLDRFVMKHVPTGLDLEEELSTQKRVRRKALESELRASSHDDDDDAASSVAVTERRDLTEDESLRVRKILACAARMQGRYGKALLAATLRGSRSAKVTQFGLDRLTTYGILSDMTQDEILALVDALVSAGCLAVTTGSFPTVSLTPEGSEVMRERASVQLALPRPRPAHARSYTAAASARQPSTPSRAEDDDATTRTLAPRRTTVDETYDLYTQGHTIEEICRMRGLTEFTVEKHLADCIAEGRPFDVSRHVRAEDRALIEEAAARLGTERLKPLRESLPRHVNYRMIRFVLADLERAARRTGDEEFLSSI